MSAPLIRHALILAILAMAAFATASVVSAEAPDRWDNETCHALDGGRTLCIEDHGSIQDNSSGAGGWIYQYRGDTKWTVYAADGSVEHTERTQVHVLQKGQGPASHREHETFRYRYNDADYTCQAILQFHLVDGHVQLDHEVDGCTIS